MLTNYTINGVDLNQTYLPVSQVNLSASTAVIWTWGAANTPLGNDVNRGLIMSAPMPLPPYVGYAAIGRQTAASMFMVAPNGTLWAWGVNAGNQLGLGSPTTISSPTQVGSMTGWKTVAVTSTNSIGIKTDGTMWGCGSNIGALLGNSNPASVPVFTQLGKSTNWDSVTPLGAGTYGFAAIKTDGTMWSWGLATNGTLGDGTLIAKSSPVQIGTLNTWAYVAGNNGTAAAIKTDGTLWMWGLGSSGQMGDGTITSKSSPIQVGSSTWSGVALNNGGGIAGIRTDGTLWGWGANGNGSIGDGSLVSKSVPVQVGSLTDWAKIYCNGEQTTTYAIKTDGTLWAWGVGISGQLGNGAVLSVSSPVQVGSLTNWVSIVATNACVIGVTSS